MEHRLVSCRNSITSHEDRNQPSTPKPPCIASRALPPTALSHCCTNEDSEQSRSKSYDFKSTSAALSVRRQQVASTVNTGISSMGPLLLPPPVQYAAKGFSRHSHSWPLTGDLGLVQPTIAMTPPLTPPEKDSFSFTSLVNDAENSSTQLSMTSEGSAETVMPLRQSSGQSSDRPSAIQLPASDNFEQQNDHGTWLDRALRHLQPSSELALTAPNFQVVAQAMPGYAGDAAESSKQIFEEVVARLQEAEGGAPNITITHVYTSRQDVSLKDAPVSPPSTPSTLARNDYFDYQSTFTNIARIRDYHSVENGQQRLASNKHVAPPNSVHASILERYLPPTTRQEVQDFFTLCKRSYLVDRLTELQDGTWGPNGALLLVYPTLTGGRTFKTYYKDPLLDPLLRRFMLLRGLTTKAGEALGRMDAIDALMEFEDMRSAIDTICRGLGVHAPPSGRASRFSIEHAERMEIILEHETWVQQFIAQESSRMKQDLIDYQKSGQRMPSQGYEASPAALAREVEAGIKTSTEIVGGIGIEMGVFVIRKSLV